MTNLKNRMQEIISLLNEIENKYPELYKNLNNNSLTIPVVNHPFIDKDVLAEYLNNLNRLLNHHVKQQQLKLS